MTENLAQQIARKAIELCNHTIMDNGEDWITGGADTDVACSSCIEDAATEVLK